MAHETLHDSFGGTTMEWADAPASSRSSSGVVPAAPARAGRATVSRVLLDLLVEAGVDTIFAVPGGAASPFFDALTHRPEIRLIVAKHETGAAFLAVGHALATGRPAAVVTTAGPGFTNVLTGLATAFHEGLPVLFLAGEVPRSAFGRGALQDSSATGIDAVAMARSIAKWSVQVAHAASAPGLFRKAIAIALSPRQGPVFLSLPLDVGAEIVAPGTWEGAREPGGFQIGIEGCQRARDLLTSAERPLIIAGAGARCLESRRVLVATAEHFACPVAVTPKGKGVFPEDHPLYLGGFGYGGHESVTDYLTGGADVILACGTGLDDVATNGWSAALEPRRAFVQVDIDPAVIGRGYPVDLALVGPMDRVLTAITKGPRVARAPITAGPRTQRCPPSPDGRITSAEAMAVLDAECPDDALFTADLGEHLAFAIHYLRITHARGFLACLGFSSMGSGICSAIGHQLGEPARRTYAVCGDGGFLMFGGELATAVQHGARTTFVVINDSRLNMCHHGMRDVYGRTLDFSSSPVDFALLARAHGAAGVVVRTAADLTEALRLPLNGPMVLDVRIDPDVRIAGSQRNATLRQFQEGDTHE
jgi:acetolactate synthase I/II/III large subunit